LVIDAHVAASAGAPDHVASNGRGGGGGPLTVLGAHLCPYSGARRLREARRLARVADAARPVLLLGDLNSLDPWTDHTATLARLPRRYRARHLRRGWSGDTAAGDTPAAEAPAGNAPAGNAPAVDTRAVAALERAGLTDLYRLAGSGPPATAPTGYAGAEFSGMRLDYALGSRSLAPAVRDCHAVTGGAAHTASDHYPIVVTMDLRAGPGRPTL
jgi:endonuclease/exonuclease/phosphatase family metal-dependent hydrolase